MRNLTRPMVSTFCSKSPLTPLCNDYHSPRPMVAVSTTWPNNYHPDPLSMFSALFPYLSPAKPHSFGSGSSLSLRCLLNSHYCCAGTTLFSSKASNHVLKASRWFDHSIELGQCPCCWCCMGWCQYCWVRLWLCYRCKTYTELDTLI